MNTVALFIMSVAISHTASERSGMLAFSGDFQKGVEAYKKDDCATAINEWTPLAKNNHTKAQHNRLLLTFKNGNEVP